jgi:hypothetical protein
MSDFAARPLTSSQDSALGDTGRTVPRSIDCTQKSCFVLKTEQSRSARKGGRARWSLKRFRILGSCSKKVDHRNSSLSRRFNPIYRRVEKNLCTLLRSLPAPVESRILQQMAMLSRISFTVQWAERIMRKIDNVFACSCGITRLRRSELFRVQLHQHSAFTPPVPRDGRWRDRSPLERRGLDSPLGVL